jgi:hypothetical protein
LIVFPFGFSIFFILIFLLLWLIFFLRFRLRLLLLFLIIILVLSFFSLSVPLGPCEAFIHELNPLCDFTGLVFVDGGFMLFLDHPGILVPFIAQGLEPAIAGEFVNP